jgi:alpha 1,3-glucosidase
MKLSLLLLVTILVALSLAVDRSKFKTCGQSSFCNRQRNFVNGLLDYYIVPGSAQLNGATFSAKIEERSSNTQFTLDITRYTDDVLRIKINEQNPLKQRYEVKDVVMENSLQEVAFTSFNPSTFELGLDEKNNLKFIIDPNSLKIDLHDGEDIRVSFNQRGLFYFEQLRKKEEAAPPSPSSSTEKHEYQQIDDTEAEDLEKAYSDVYAQNTGAADTPSNPEAESPPHQHVPSIDMNNAWEENFGSHKDSKPNGPSSIGLDITFPNTAHVYGIPEHATNFALKPTRGEGINSDPYRLYNLDVFEYELDQTMALYGSVPVMFAHNEKKSTGIFWLNSSEMWIDVEQADKSTATHWMSESGVVDLWIMLGPKPVDVFRQYKLITGPQAMPPMWSVAYHQCRWNYRTSQEVHEVDMGFDEHDMPYDVIWLDIEHTDNKKYFTWNSDKFPDPDVMLANLTARGKKMVTIIDPHIKRDDNYYVHQEAKSQSLYVKDANNNDYEGWCWPGSSSWLDFTNPQVRDYWASLFEYSKYKYSTPNLFTWNDMNEPSVFNGPEITMHKDARHWGGAEHRDVHNVYGFYQQMATAQGQVARDPQKNTRPFVLSRAFFAGSQRYGAVWTGDNLADWGHLRDSLPMLLSLSVSGIQFCGADVGGFFKDPDAKLLTRWNQAGVFYPFFRGHAHIDTKRREPWVFGEPYTLHIRSALRMRYSLLPYWYTLFHQAEQTGMAPLRPLWAEFPSDPQTFGIEDTVLVGPNLLGKPVTESDASSIDVYLPGAQQIWYDYDTYEAHQGGQSITVATPLDKIPAFLRGSGIIPRQDRQRRSSAQMKQDPYTLVVALDSNSKASGELYLDDGETFNYKQGQYLVRAFNYTARSANQHRLSASAIHQGTFSTKNQVERVIVIGLKKSPTAVKHQDRALEFTYDSTQQILLIRRPGVLVAADWDITITL